MTQVTYLIASHTNPRQVIRLVKTLKAGSPQATVVIHHDYSKSYLDPSALKGMDGVHIIEDYVPVKWGDFSLVRMTLHAIEWISNRLVFDWLVFISGQDYPIQPLHQIERFLETTHYDGFLRGVALEGPTPCGPGECMKESSPRKRCKDCETRYYYQYFAPHAHRLPARLRKKLLRRARQSFNKKAQSLFQIRTVAGQTEPKLVFGIRAPATPFSSDFRCYKGSSWFTLNRDCIQYIGEYVHSHPRFVRYYRRTLVPDESFFQTIILNHPTLNILNDNKRFTLWRDSTSPHPEVLGVQDFEHIVASNQHFARKFDINVDEAVLDMLDRYVMSIVDLNNEYGQAVLATTALWPGCV